jgi:hypothetical protein
VGYRDREGRGNKDSKDDSSAITIERRRSPGLDLVESLKHGHGDEDDNSLLSSLDVDLLGGGDGELLQLGLELGNVGLQVEDGLGNGLLDLIGGTGRGVGSSLNLGSVGSHFEGMKYWWSFWDCNQRSNQPNVQVDLRFSNVALT